MESLSSSFLSVSSKSPWISTSIHQNPSKSSGFRVECRSQFSSKDLKFVLHHALDSSGCDTTHARAAREGFCAQIRNLSEIERETSICINKHVDLGKTALYIAAEDDSLVSHSSVPLPVEAFLDRLGRLSASYCPHYRSSFASFPEDHLDNVEKYLYITKVVLGGFVSVILLGKYTNIEGGNDEGFRRANAGYRPDPKVFYLHSVLAQRIGSVAVLSLIHSEILKMLRFSGVINFDVEIYYPHDLVSLPRAYNKKKGRETDQQHIMTAESLLVEILRNLKTTYWPFHQGQSKSLFLMAADATNCTDSGFERASAKAAQHRLDRGVWTSVLFGDMRRALAACEHLILLEADLDELRDYAILLYHCSYYEEALQYLQFYKEIKKTSESLSNNLEDDIVEKLIIRLNLIMMEEGWVRPSKSFLRNSEPW